MPSEDKAADLNTTGECLWIRKDTVEFPQSAILLQDLWRKSGNCGPCCCCNWPKESQRSESQMDLSITQYHLYNLYHLNIHRKKRQQGLCEHLSSSKAFLLYLAFGANEDRATPALFKDLSRFFRARVFVSLRRSQLISPQSPNSSSCDSLSVSSARRFEPLWIWSHQCRV